eukprot:1460986-Amphidinium_carterae.1
MIAETCILAIKNWNYALWESTLYLLLTLAAQRRVRHVQERQVKFDWEEKAPVPATEPPLPVGEVTWHG